MLMTKTGGHLTAKLEAIYRQGIEDLHKAEDYKLPKAGKVKIVRNTAGKYLYKKTKICSKCGKHYGVNKLHDTLCRPCFLSSGLMEIPLICKYCGRDFIGKGIASKNCPECAKKKSYDAHKRWLKSRPGYYKTYCREYYRAKKGCGKGADAKRDRLPAQDGANVVRKVRAVKRGAGKDKK
jgi:hypothetical protein